jgi:hypothetical protein
MSHSNAYDKKTAARDGATFQIEWQYDDSPDLSYLGEYTDKPGEWTIDRKNGWLLGEHVNDHITYYASEEERQLPEDERNAALEVRLDKWFLDHPWFEADFYEQVDEYSIDAYYYGYEVLATDLRGTYERNSYRYFVPANSYTGESFPDVDQAERVKYILQDFERMEDANRGYWSPVGCVVTMYIEGEEVAYASLWGIESDCGEDYTKEVEEDLIDECISDARKNSAALAAKYRELADKLDNLSE